MSPHPQAASHTFKGVHGTTPIERDYCDALERLANAAETVIELEYKGQRTYVPAARGVEAMSEYDAAKESLKCARKRLEGPRPRRNEHNERVMLAKLLSLEEEPEP